MVRFLTILCLLTAITVGILTIASRFHITLRVDPVEAPTGPDAHLTIYQSK